MRFRAAPLITVLALIAVPPVGSQEDPDGGYSPLPVFEQFGEPASEADGQAIEALIERAGRAWRSGDVEGSVAAYSEDAEWVNAFGDVRRGHAELREQFRYLFARFESDTDAQDSSGSESSSEADAASQSAPSRGRISLRHVGPTAAVLHSYVESNWGRNRNSDEGPRRIYITRVVEKRDGNWLIVHQMIMDARR